MDTSPFNSTIIERIDLNDTNFILRIRPDAAPVPAFTAGQFVMLGLPHEGPDPAEEKAAAAAAANPAAAAAIAAARARKGPRMVKRAYSIASPPRIRDYLEFFIVRVDEGRLTPRLWKMKPGDPIWMELTAKGEFTLDEIPTGVDLVTVSTGTGIAPFVAMLYEHLDQPRWNRYVLLNGCRLASDLGYRAELEALARREPRFVYLPSVTREPADSPWTGLRGRIPAQLEADRFRELAGFDLDPARCHVLLCGNPDMINDVQKSLEARGFVTATKTSPGNVHYERYW
ncbi:MAG: ferredoxin--NADP reductase [Phycisphaerales bacterium]|nr:ferredoxin--NADP reductase [Phycisphaerales bacterium]